MTTDTPDKKPKETEPTSPPKVSEDNDRTLFVPTQPPLPPEAREKPPDDDQTRFVPTQPPLPPSERPAPEANPDRTMFIPGAVTPADDDRTRLGPPAVMDDQTPAIDPVEGFEGTNPPGEVSAAAIAAVPPPTRATLEPAPVRPSTTALGVGTLINNNYEIQQVLKSGGMGEVFRGVEIGTGDPVAIKAILPELAEDEKAGLLFKREARTLRQLSDEAIVRYYNYVHDRDLDRYFLVMEFIEGTPLSDRIDQQGAIPATAALALMKRLAKGLSKAHAKDVIHRDLSPDNVMLPKGDVNDARLIDFGIAKSNVVKESTMAGQFAGKFKYVAPEQLGHFDGHISPATDIYGLALLICAAAIGRPLDMGSSIVEAVKTRQTIPDLSALPEPLRPIIAHMLEPDPLARPVSMDVLCDMLDAPSLIPHRYRDGLPMPPALDSTGRAGLPTAPPITAPPPGLQVPIPRTPVYAGQPQTAPPDALPPLVEEKSGSRLLSLLVVAFLAVLGGGGWYAWQAGMLGGEQVAETPQGTSAVTTGIPAPDTTSREGFLAAFDTGPCTFTTRIAAGANAGLIEGYSSTGEAFGGLPVAYEEKFGARPAVLPREITTAQCAALAFAKSLQGRGRAPVVSTLSADAVPGNEPVSATIRTRGDTAIWTVLITPDGSVFNLTPQLSEPVGGVRSLGFRLQAPAEAAPQLILSVSSETPLVRAANARDGTPADVLLPAILEEIAERGGAASAALSYLLLEP